MPTIKYEDKKGIFIERYVSEWTLSCALVYYKKVNETSLTPSYAVFNDHQLDQFKVDFDGENNFYIYSMIMQAMVDREKDDREVKFNRPWNSEPEEVGAKFSDDIPQEDGEIVIHVNDGYPIKENADGQLEFDLGPEVTD